MIDERAGKDTHVHVHVCRSYSYWSSDSVSETESEQLLRVRFTSKDLLRIFMVSNCTNYQY